MVNKQGKRIFLFGLLSLFAASYGQQGVLPFSSCTYYGPLIPINVNELISEGTLKNVLWTFKRFLVGKNA